ncbi:MAG TPA: hypothetical protein VLX28_04925 [Thermoanaerobaculia bacterium]|nr:hypothetical protein [Thermoanaerobaculia bacterium]
MVFIDVLLWHADGLGLFIAQAHPQTRAFGGNRQVLISKASDQVEGLLRRLLLSFPHGVGFDVGLDGCTYLRRCPEVPVSWHEPAQRLMRSLEVVAFDEEPEPTLAVGEVREDRAAQKLVPQRLPEALDLAEGFRVLGPTLDVPDSILAQSLLEDRLAPPGRVLPSLIRQCLLRHPEGCNAPLESFQDQRALLVMGQYEAHDETRVVVHEGRQVQPLVASQQECEDVRLPHLIRRCSLEAPRRPLPTIDRPRAAARCHPRLSQHSSDGGLRDAECLETPDHITDPPSPVLGMLLLERRHRGYHRIVSVQRARLAARRLRLQCLLSAELVGNQPVSDRHLRDVEGFRHQTERCLALDHLLHDFPPHLERVDP